MCIRDRYRIKLIFASWKQVHRYNNGFYCLEAVINNDLLLILCTHLFQVCELQGVFSPPPTRRDNLSNKNFEHSSIKKYQCDVCTKSFREHWYLSNHILIHYGHKKFQCDVCSKSFKQPQCLSLIHIWYFNLGHRFFCRF